MTAEELLQLLRSDECYYEVTNAKQTWWTAIEMACDWAADKMQAEEEAQAKIDEEVSRIMYRVPESEQRDGFGGIA